MSPQLPHFPRLGVRPAPSRLRSGSVISTASRPASTYPHATNLKTKWRRKPLSRWAIVELSLLGLTLGLIAAAPWGTDASSSQPQPVCYPNGSGIGP